MKTVLITGVGRGIGKALAEKFLKEGFQVIGTVLNSIPSSAVQNLKIYKLDLSDSSSIKGCVDSIKKDGTKIDILINNAGALFDEDETCVVIEKLRKTLEVNLIGTIDFTEQALVAINSGGHIVSISSQAGSLDEMDRILDSHYPYHYPAYKISKCALNMYLRTLAVRLTHENKDITVSAVHPGWVKTDMGGDEATDTPEEVANDVYELAISKPETGQFWYKGKRFPW